MPRSAFFSKETIAAAGLEIVRRQGVTAHTARALSKQLGCSLSPIFTVFEDMDGIRIAVRQAVTGGLSGGADKRDDFHPVHQRPDISEIRQAGSECDSTSQS